MSEDKEFRQGLTTGAHQILDEKDLEIQRLKGLLADGLAVIEDFMPNIGNCALQDYGRLNQFLMDADKELKDECDSVRHPEGVRQD